MVRARFTRSHIGAGCALAANTAAASPGQASSIRARSQSGQAPAGSAGGMLALRPPQQRIDQPGLVRPAQRAGKAVRIT